MKAYRYSSPGVVWVAVVFAGMIGQLLVAWLLWVAGGQAAFGSWAIAVTVMPLLATVGFGYWLHRHQQLQRRAGLAAVLTSEGFTVDLRPDAAIKEAYYVGTAGLVDALNLPNGSKGIHWIAFQGQASSATRIFEHEYTSGAGKSRQCHPSTVMMWPTGNPGIGQAALANAQMASLYQPGFWTKWKAIRLGPRDQAFEAFRRKWAVIGDMSTAERFVTAPVAQQLLATPKGERWWIGGGFLAVRTAGHLDASNLRRFLEHVRTIAGSRS